MWSESLGGLTVSQETFSHVNKVLLPLLCCKHKNPPEVLSVEEII